jgi:hypothetical protein
MVCHALPCLPQIARHFPRLATLLIAYQWDTVPIVLQCQGLGLSGCVSATTQRPIKGHKSAWSRNKCKSGLGAREGMLRGLPPQNGWIVLAATDSVLDLLDLFGRQFDVELPEKVDKLHHQFARVGVEQGRCPSLRIG